MKHLIALTALVSSVLLAACASDSSSDAPRPTTGSATSSSPTTTGTSTTDTSAASPTAGMPSASIVYFAFDSSDLGPDALSLVEGWAKYLGANPDARVRLEGHADERGTREYNIGLGERRSLSVRDALVSRGVSARQLGVASFGEERPVVLDSNEEAWRQNRRVEIVQ